jgi:hypothetical protein
LIPFWEHSQMIKKMRLRYFITMHLAYKLRIMGTCGVWWSGCGNGGKWGIFSWRRGDEAALIMDHCFDFPRFSDCHTSARCETPASTQTLRQVPFMLYTFYCRFKSCINTRNEYTYESALRLKNLSIMYIT